MKEEGEIQAWWTEDWIEGVRKMNDTPRTAQDALKAQGELVRKSYEDKIARLENELAAAIEQRDKASADLIYTTVLLARLRNTAIADAGLMACKGYDLFPDGTLRPAHGLGEWVKAEEYDKLHAAAKAAQAEIAALRDFVDKNMTFYDVDADSLVDAPNIPVLAQVSNRIWYHATDDTKSCPFSAVIDAAMKGRGK